ncbi:MAG: glycoside hydrolase family 92 protein, partial [Tannerellaceae bacterium]|nr:glycoside hydrolase family 92 protein [Tannerellaceae bacterium]
MKSIVGNIFGIALCALSLSVSAQNTFTDKVNPIIGTNGMGHTFPGACVPFGLIQLSPDTDTIPHNIDGQYQARAYEYCAGYQYKDSSIVGFSHTHLSGTGHSDLGDILLMPFTGELKLNPGTATDPDAGYRSRFSHDTETARPGYYEVTLEDYGVRAQLTTTERVGVHKYTYPKGEEKQLILDLNHGIYNYDGKVLWVNLRVENDTLLTGYRITNGWSRVNYVYFAISFSKPIV